MSVFEERDAVVERLTEAGWRPDTYGTGAAAASKPSGSKYAGKKSNDDGGSEDVGGKKCKHGQRTRKTGRSKKGTWVGYFCPQRECNPVWDNDQEEDETADF